MCTTHAVHIHCCLFLRVNPRAKEMVQCLRASASAVKWFGELQEMGSAVLSSSHTSSTKLSVPRVLQPLHLLSHFQEALSGFLFYSLAFSTRFNKGIHLSHIFLLDSVCVTALHSFLVLCPAVWEPHSQAGRHLGCSYARLIYLLLLLMTGDRNRTGS